jgi:hypothetical protein
MCTVPDGSALRIPATAPCTMVAAVSGGRALPEEVGQPVDRQRRAGEHERSGEKGLSARWTDRQRPAGPIDRRYRPEGSEVHLSAGPGTRLSPPEVLPMNLSIERSDRDVHRRAGPRTS